MAKMAKNAEKCPFWAILAFFGVFGPSGASQTPPGQGFYINPSRRGPAVPPGRGWDLAPPRRGGTPPEEGAGGPPLGERSGGPV